MAHGAAGAGGTLLAASVAHAVTSRARSWESGDAGPPGHGTVRPGRQGRAQRSRAGPGLIGESSSPMFPAASGVAALARDQGGSALGAAAAHADAWRSVHSCDGANPAPSCVRTRELNSRAARRPSSPRRTGAPSPASLSRCIEPQVQRPSTVPAKVRGHSGDERRRPGSPSREKKARGKLSPLDIHSHV